MLKEFREFALKGNMMDLAIGIVIGAAFGAIISSLVKDILMPPIGMLAGKIDFKDMMMVLKEGTPVGPYATVDAAQKAGAVTLNYGLFLNTLINFVIVAMALFFVVKSINRLKRKQLEEPAVAPKPSNEEILLGEIRDLIAQKA